MNSSTVNGGTVLTIPAGRSWVGSIMLAATLMINAGGAPQFDYPAITVSGTGANWTDGDFVLRLALSVPGAVLGTQSHSELSIGLVQITAGENPIDLVLSFGADTTAAGTAIGELL